MIGVGGDSGGGEGDGGSGGPGGVDIGSVGGRFGVGGGVARPRVASAPAHGEGAGMSNCSAPLWSHVLVRGSIRSYH